MGNLQRELRIGNLVYSKETNQLQKITGLTDENPFIDAITFDYTNYDEIEAIPLTEEWLLKFGFEKNFENLIEILINKNQSLHFDETDNFMSLYIPINHEFIYLVFKHIKYVHQLQNLFFALTGEELEIKQ